MSELDISVITVCMNRQQHLFQTAQRVSAWTYHSEHLILDWSSHQQIQRSQLPDDSRIRLERVDGEQRWNLCRAYNFAAHLSRGSVLLKLDADCWPDLLDASIYLDSLSSCCWFGSGPNGRLGQFLMARTAFEAVGGFNEVLEGYGFDDKDLKARLDSLDFQIQSLPLSAIGVIAHSIHERVSRQDVESGSTNVYEQALSSAQRRVSALSNRVSAASYPWTRHRRCSRYLQQGDGNWLVIRNSTPVLASDSKQELMRLRRRVFWASFLYIPEDAIRRLPLFLLGLETEQGFQIAWFHRLYWLVITRPLLTLLLVLEPGFWRSFRR